MMLSSHGILRQGARAFRSPAATRAFALPSTAAGSARRFGTVGFASQQQPSIAATTSAYSRGWLLSKRIGSSRSMSSVISKSLAPKAASPMAIRPRSALFEAAPRGQQSRGARWEQYTKANYGSRRGNSYRNSGRRWSFLPEVSPEATVYAIIGLNGVVFLLWKSGQERMNSFHDSKMMAWMMRNFTAMWVNLKEGRIWTLVTPAFSHIEPMHLLINMFVLYSFGTDIARLIGPKRFLAFYLGAAACGNMISAYLRGVVMPRRTGNYSTAVQPAVGASTSVVGITTLFACLYPHATFQLFFFVPVPAWLATAGFIGWDVWRVMRSDRTKVDGAGHLGGAAAGLGYYWFRLRPLIRRMR